MSEALPYVGAAVGAFWGNPQLGWAIGSALSMAFAPTQKSQGPRLEDLKITGTAYGQPIPWIQGTHRTAGQVIWASDRREIATTTEQGKGGGAENTTYTYEADYLYLLSSNELDGLLRVWDNGKLIYSVDDDSSDSSLIASSESPLWRRITFYSGDAAQLPDPTYEAVVGAGNAPAYRDMCTIFIEGLQLGQSGQLPNLTFEVGTNLTPSSMQDYQDKSQNNYPVTNNYASDPATIGFQGVFADVGKFGAGGIFSGDFITPKQGLGIGTVANTPAMGAGNWTIQAWLYNGAADYSSARGTIVSAGLSNGTANGIFFSFDLNGALQLVIRKDGGGGFNLIEVSDPAIFPLSTQFHFAVERTGEFIIGYIDGVPVVTAELPSAFETINLTELWEIGGNKAAQANWQGVIDDFSFSTIARYNGAFDPPQTPHVSDQFTQIYIPFFRVDTFVRGYETIRTVVERLCARAQMPAGTYDASELDGITKPLRALAVSQVGGTRTVLDMLAQTFFFQQYCTDKVYFVPRAESVVLTIPYADLGVTQPGNDSPEPFELRQRNDLEVPAQEAITYANVSDDYQSDTQYSDRLLSGQTNTGTTEVPLGFTPSEAKAIADAKVTDGVIAMWSAPVILSRKYSRLTPGDSVVVEDDDGSTYRVLMGKLTQSSGVLTFDTRLEDPTVFTQAGITGGDYNPQTEVVAIPGTFLYMLDIPQLRDADNGVGLYAAARGLAPAWPGARVFESTDELSWNPRVDITDTGVLGSTLTEFPDWAGGNVFDETNTVDVNVGAGTLSSATRDAVLGDRLVNSILIGDEVLQYCTATLQSAGVYRLSRFLRERLGTDRLTSAAPVGSRFVLLQNAGMRRIDQENAALAALRYFKGVSLGRSLATAATQEVTNYGVSVTPLSVVNVRANRNTTDTEITWQRRTRMQTRFLGPLSSSVPLGEAIEAYIIEIYSSSAFTTLVRTLASSTQSVTYTSAEQVADFGSNQTVLYVRIYQLSEIVGRGFVRQATI